VLSVGAVDQNNGRASFSDTKSTVQVTAPGADITSTYPGTNGNAHSQVQGTSFAAPFVSGLAALVWARYPYLSAQQVVQRIEDTADGPAGLGTGHGLINPVQAITAVQPFGAPSAPPAKAQAVRIDRTPNHASEKIVVLSLTGGSLVVVLLVAAAAVIIPAGRRRRWQPGA
jgi:subtilisin family serine protease